MDRLTYKGGIYHYGTFATIVPKRKDMEIKLQNVVDALGKYEDIAYPPGEITAALTELAALKADMEALNKKLAATENARLNLQRELSRTKSEVEHYQADMEAGRLVRVVRCKDCALGDSNGIKHVPGMVYCDHLDMGRGDHFFCAAGAEKDGQDG